MVCWKSKQHTQSITLDGGVNNNDVGLWRVGLGTGLALIDYIGHELMIRRH